MTAVEWLYKNLLENPMSNQDVKYNEAVFHNAKEMHKQEIITAYAFGHNDGCRYMTNEKQEFEHGEQYYNETYNK